MAVVRHTFFTTSAGAAGLVLATLVPPCFWAVVATVVEAGLAAAVLEVPAVALTGFLAVVVAAAGFLVWVLFWGALLCAIVMLPVSINTTAKNSFIVFRPDFLWMLCLKSDYLVTSNQLQNYSYLVFISKIGHNATKLYCKGP